MGWIPRTIRDLLTTKGDIAVHDGTSPVRLPVGSDDQVLTADSGESSGVKWADSTGGGSLVTAKVVTDAVQSGIPTSSWTKMVFADTPEYDTDSWWSAANDEFTVSEAGLYAVSASAQWDTNEDGPTRAMAVWKNGVNTGGGVRIVQATNTPVPFGRSHAVYVEAELAVNDTLAVGLFQNSGNNRSLLLDDDRQFLAVRFLGTV